MREGIQLLRSQPQVRLFFAAIAQSSLGTGAGYVALLLIAYGRFHSPWAISLVLLADFLPAMVLGPLFGAAADRWSRRWCVVTADSVRALAFVGIALVNSFGLTLVCALLAGTGTALFRPSALAGLPSLVPREKGPAATSLYGAITDLGWTVGPGLAAAALLVASPESLTLANGVTFAVSALALSRLPLDRASADAARAAESPKESLFREGVSGWRAVVAVVDVRIVILAATTGMFFGGLFNVAELLFAQDSLGAGASGYSVLVTLYGLGFIAGSLRGASGGEPPLLRRRFTQGLTLTGMGSLLTAFAPSLPIAMATFALAGFGNGLLVVYERLLIQHQIPEALQGRAFGLNDTLASWGLAAAFLSAGVAASFAGPRGLILVTAVGELAIALLAFAALRSSARRLGWAHAESGRGSSTSPVREQQSDSPRAATESERPRRLRA